MLPVFTLIGLSLSALADKIGYLFMFVGIGAASSVGELLMIRFPKGRQFIRRSIQISIGGFLFIGLSLYGNVNFQFPEIFFDLFAGVTTGALIQFIIARLILPFFIGNGFCSRVCWDGAIFEFAQPMIPKCKTPKARKEILAFTYMSFVIIIASIVSFIYNPAIFEHSKRYWIVGENILILLIGIYLSRFWGSRTYCRTFCPFITISGMISRYSIFKISPVNPAKCTSCRKCNKSCPMLVDVMSSVKTNQRVFNKSCIACERCVDACPENCLEYAPDLPWK